MTDTVSETRADDSPTTSGRTGAAAAQDAGDGLGTACRRVDFGLSLAVVLRRWHEAVDTALASVPHGPRGFQVLSVVVHDTPPTQAALAAQLGIDRTVMTYVLDDLGSAGLVERHEVPGDRRARRVVATHAGEQTLRGLEDAVADAEATVLACLDPAERSALHALVHRVAGDGDRS